MALVTYALPIDELAGSLGGVVFQRTKAGNTVRRRAKPRLAITPATAERKTFMSVAADEWFSRLSQVDRDSWDTSAASATFVNSLGHNYNISGYQAWCRATIAARSVGIDSSARSPQSIVMNDQNLAFDYNPPDEIRVTSWGTPIPPQMGTLALWISDLQRATIQTFNYPYATKFLASFSPFPGTPTIVAAIPAVHADSRVFFRWRLVKWPNVLPNPPFERGQTSVPQTDSLFVDEAP